MKKEKAYNLRTTNFLQDLNITIKAYRIEKCSHFSTSLLSLPLSRSIDIESILTYDPTDLEALLELVF